jgi:hypothetical protein
VAGLTAGRNDEEEDSENESETKKAKPAGFAIEYEAARKIAQSLGAHLESLSHWVEISGDQARLLPVAERTQHLFGKEEEATRTPARKKKSAQLDMFAELTESEDAETVRHRTLGRPSVSCRHVRATGEHRLEAAVTTDICGKKTPMPSGWITKPWKPSGKPGFTEKSRRPYSLNRMAG